MSQKAKTNMHLAVWEHGNRKRIITVTIKGLLSIPNLKDDPVIQEAIKILERERERLKNTNPFD